MNVLAAVLLLAALALALRALRASAHRGDPWSCAERDRKRDWDRLARAKRGA